MQKMMYLCPVDWRWVKQRPQFLAEELHPYFDLRVVYPYRNDRRSLQKAKHTQVKLSPWFSLPTLSGKLRFVGKANVVLLKLQMLLLLKIIKPDILWLSMPWQINSFPSNLSCRIIYDCMDDYAAITPNRSDVNALVEQEKKIIERADVIFASSENLQRKLAARHHIDLNRICLLRNGYNANWTYERSKAENVQMTNAKVVRIGYFGTLGRWFDFELLLKSLEKYPQIEYYLFGPLESGIQIPQHKCLIYCGVLEHDKLREQANHLNALMMPFVVNDIVRSVDPVKLYEYIWMEKPIICVQYPEIERFAPFVSFYRTQEEYFAQIESLISGTSRKYSHEQAASFLAENNWSKRAETASHIIKHTAERGN